MPDFDKLEQEAQQAAEGHSSQVDEAVTKGEQGIDQRVGQDHASQVQDAGSELEKELGTDQGGSAADQQPPGQQ
jgi:hypothetical protein